MSAPSVPDPSLARAINARRLKLGRTQEDLAHAAGLSVAAWARIERGQSNPTWTTVRRIAAALDLSLGDLIRAVEVAD